MKTISVKKNQTLLDIAVEQYGGIEGVYWIVQDNRLEGIIDNVFEGQYLTIREDAINQRLAHAFQASGVSTLFDAQPCGIGFWAIDKDFIVD